MHTLNFEKRKRKKRLKSFDFSRFLKEMIKIDIFLVKGKTACGLGRL